MKLADIKNFCHVFYRRFSSLNLYPFQLKYIYSQDSVSITLINHNETEDIEAAIYINDDTVRLLKINSYEKIDTNFIYDTPLELYTNLLTLLVLSCQASGIKLSPMDALNVTLGQKTQTWRELVIYICSLATEKQGIIHVQENRQNALRFLQTTFRAVDGEFITDGLFKSRIKYKDILELIRAVLDGVSAVLKIHDYIIDPFFMSMSR